MKLRNVNRYTRAVFLVMIILVNFQLYSQSGLQKPSRQAAIDAYVKGNYEKAYDEFSILLLNYSKDPLYNYYSGVCLVMLNREPERAETYLQAALDGSLDIKSIPRDALFYLGRSQQLAGNFQEAVQSYNDFAEKVGRKRAKEFRTSDLIHECNSGKGRLTVADVISNNVPAENAGNNIQKPVPVREDVPADYEKVLTDAMSYQVKADSLNSLVTGYKREYESLTDSQKQVVKSRIKVTESLAAENQKLADEKFVSSGIKPVALEEKKELEEKMAPEIVKVTSIQDPAQKKTEVFSMFEVKNGNNLQGDQKIMLDPVLPEGLIYRIQIGVFNKPMDAGYFKGISPAAGFRIQGTESTRYFLGMFRRMEDASRALQTVRQTGFRDAFVTAVLDGKPVSPDRAQLLEKEWGSKPLEVIVQPLISEKAEPSTLLYKVEISRGSKPVTNEVLDTYKTVAGNRGLEILSSENNNFVYLIGKFITFESANDYASLLVRNGFRDAKVTAYLGTKELPVETAKQLFEKQK